MDEVWDTGAPPGDETPETAALSGSEGAQEQPAADVPAGTETVSAGGALRRAAKRTRTHGSRGPARRSHASSRPSARSTRTCAGFSDLPKMASFPRFIELAQRGCGFVDAFRAANFDAIVERRAGAARQAALNEMRSTRRFEPVGGAAEPASDLTQEEMDWWKAFGFSEKKARYYHNKYKKER